MYAILKKSGTAIVMFSVAILQEATAKPPNILAHEKSFKFTAPPQTGANSYLKPRPPRHVLTTHYSDQDLVQRRDSPSDRVCPRLRCQDNGEL